MRNLQLESSISQMNAIVRDATAISIATYVVSSGLETRLFLVTADEELYVLVIGREHKYEEPKLVMNVKKLCPEPVSRVIGIKKLYDELCIVYASGYVMMFSLTKTFSVTDNTIIIEKVIDKNVKQMYWCPNQSKVVFISEDNTIMTYSSGFKLLSEVDIYDLSKGESQFVTVGWGSEATQFKGTASKLSNGSKVSDETTTKDTKVPDETMSLTWREDSEYFAVSYWCKVSQMRKIKIFDDFGFVQYVADDITGLQPPIGWCSSLNLIVAIREISSKFEGIFLENNGLRFGGKFRIPDNYTVKSFEWNITSVIMAVQARYEPDGCDAVLLYTFSNATWYLKQDIRLKGNIQCMLWDERGPRRLHILIDNATYRMFEWNVQAYFTSHLHMENDETVVAVVDGDTLKLSNCKTGLIPPPLSSTTFSFSSSINHVVFPSNVRGSHSNKYMYRYVAVVLTSLEVVILKLDENGYSVGGKYGLRWNNKDTTADYKTTLDHYNWIWIYPDTFYFIWCMEKGHRVCKAVLSRPDNYLIIECEETQPDHLAALFSHNDSVSSFLMNRSLHIPLQHDPVHAKDKIPELCFKVQMDNNVLYSLSVSETFYMNNTVNEKSVVSFHVLHPFVLLLTTYDTILIKRFENDKLIEVGRRQMDMDSRLVTANKNIIVLQAPRGNLEVIRPRAFVFYELENLLKHLEYDKAYTLLRTQRVNLNILVDYDPDNLLQNMKQFLLKIRNINYINQFINDLSEENVLETLYSQYFGTERGKLIENKAESVCNKLRDVIQTIWEEKDYMVPVIACHAKVGNLSTALSLAVKNDLLPVLARMSTWNDVYKIALSSYDLNTSVKIAGLAEADPKQYIPFLNKLKKMDDAYRRFTIDNYFGKYQQAIQHIINNDNETIFEECLQHINKHELHKAAMKMIDRQSDRFKKLMRSYGRCLFEKRMYVEAAVMFEKGEDYENCVEAYKQANMWRDAIGVALKDKSYNTSKMNELYGSLLENLKYSELFKEAGILAYEFMHDMDESVFCLSRAKEFNYAISLAKISSNDHLIQTIITPAVDVEYESLVQILQEDEAEINKLSKRLLEVREKKSSAAPDCESDNEDYASTIASTRSRNTTRTGRTSKSSKSSRAYERRLWSLKHGNPREEKAILYNLHKLIRNFELNTGNVHNLCITLIKLDNMKCASGLQKLKKIKLNRVQEIKNQVWPLSNVQSEGGFQDLQVECPPESCIKLNWEIPVLDDEDELQ